MTDYLRTPCTEDAAGRVSFGRAISQASTVVVGFDPPCLISIWRRCYMGLQLKAALRQVSFYECLGFYSVSIIPPTCPDHIFFVCRRHYMIYFSVGKWRTYWPLCPVGVPTLCARYAASLHSHTVFPRQKLQNKNVLVRHELFADSPRVTRSGSDIIGPPPPADRGVGATAVMDQGPLIIEASRSHSDTPHLVGLLWTSNQLIEETST
jgi:hypothetical protein